MITIVISSYRYGHLAAHCIESVLSQIHMPHRILFVDDGVGDCKHLVNLYPQVEFILRKKNLGVVDNFQDMLMRVDTEYVMFLGADNWLRSDALAQLSQAGGDIVTYDMMITGELKDEMYAQAERYMRKKDGDYYYSKKKDLWKAHGSMLYKTELAKSVGGYRPNDTQVREGHPEEDFSLYNRMINIPNTIVNYVPLPLLYYRRHKENFLKYA
jgi:glycosyltransferase involved in cell wall biosynthesis